MPNWTFEPGHTAAEFRARHMMVSNVRGAFKNVRGTLDFDPANPKLSSVEAVIDTAEIWTGEPERDTHLRSPDFLDVERYPQITFKGDQVEVMAATAYKTPALSWTARLEEWFAGLLQRPRIAWEGAYVASMFLMLLIMFPGSPLAGVSQKALELTDPNKIEQPFVAFEAGLNTTFAVGKLHREPIDP